METQTNTTKCLTCDYPIEIKGEVQIGMVVECKGELKTIDSTELKPCGTTFEIINTDPIELDYLFTEK